jgi:pimeloyl-ACP methyl ester carboxylesterase
MREMLVCIEEALAVCHIIGPGDLMAHSQGTPVALALAIERPERIRRFEASGHCPFFEEPEPFWSVVARFFTGND